MPKSTTISSRARDLRQLGNEAIRRFHQRAGAWIHATTDLVFPPRCTSCDQELAEMRDDVHLCASCRAQFLGRTQSRCQGCAALLPAVSPTDRHCSRCRGRRLRFAEAVALGTYEDALRAAILKIKRPGHEPLAAAIGDLLWSTAKPRLDSYCADVVVPIPMHWFRRLRRGTNCAEIVAARLARRLRLEFHPVLNRRRNTKLHRGLLPQERFANVRGAFNVRAGYDLKATRVLLVDDIMTVGATCSEAAQVLKRHGACWVGVAVAGRTEVPD